MSEDKRYNGWANYETWNWKLWMDNDQGTQEYWQEQAQECYDRAIEDKPLTRENVAANALADLLKQGAEDNAPELQGPYADLLNAAISEIDWYEIAENLLEDVDKDAEV